jgi:hypothetical protein
VPTLPNVFDRPGCDVASALSYDHRLANVHARSSRVSAHAKSWCERSDRLGGEHDEKSSRN